MNINPPVAMDYDDTSNALPTPAVGNRTLALTAFNVLRAIVRTRDWYLSSSNGTTPSNGDNLNDKNSSSDDMGWTATAPGIVRLLPSSDVCLRLSPPPIPPWLFDSPDRLRHLVANCSSWKKYITLCSAQLPPEYPHVLSEHLPTDSRIVQWVPFLVVLLISAVIVVSAIVIYGVYRRSRMKYQYDFFAEYHKNRPSSPDTREAGGGRMIHSVTMETQLSVCAFGEDSPFAAIIPSHVMYADTHKNYDDDDGRGRTIDNSTMKADTCAPMHSGEIILRPTRLEDNKQHYEPYISELCANDAYYSSHSLPIDLEDGVYETKKRKQQKGFFPGRDFEDYDSSPYVQLHKGKSSAPVTYCTASHNGKKHSNLDRKNSVRRMIQSCKRAGVSLIHGVVWNQNPDLRIHSSKTIIQQPSGSSFQKLRQSFRNLRTSRNTYSQKSENLVQEDLPGSDTSCQYPPLSKEILENQELTCPSQHDSVASVGCRQKSACEINELKEDSSSKEQHNQAKRLKTFGRFLWDVKNYKRTPMQRPSKNRNIKSDCGTDTKNVDFTYVNEAFQSRVESEPKYRRSSFKKMKMPNVLKRLRKGRVDIDAS